MGRWRLGAALVVALVPAACSSFGETHFFKSASTDGTPPNYFRMTVSGSTALSSCRYLSGYFNEDVVDSYFNEISQPKDGAIQPAPKDGVKPLDGDKDHKKLVMILSTNADEIADQIGGLAENEEVAKSLTRLLYRDDIKSLSNARSKMDEQATNGRLVQRVGDDAIAGLPDTGVPHDQVEKALLRLVNAVASAEGSAKRFTTVPEALSWYEASRHRLLKD